MDQAGRWTWIHSPTVDLIFFTFSWMLPFLAFVLVAHFSSESVCDVSDFPACAQGAMLVFLLGDWTIQVHRHYTLALSYGDRDHLTRHRRLFVGLPLFLVLVLAVLGTWRVYPDPWRYPTYVAFMVFAIPAFAWNFPHVILQKYGLMRIYSARLGYGDPKLEKNLLLSWMFVMGAWLVLKYGETSIDGLSDGVDIDIHWLRFLVTGAGYLVYPLGAWALWVTARWILAEVRHFHPRNIPKLLYVFSGACILATGFYSAVVGFIVFGVSHAIEYVAFLSVYSEHRPPLSSWIRNPITLNLICAPGTLALLLSIHYGAPTLFFAYTLFNTYLHLIYDGYIWKIREAPIRTAVLAIGSAREASARNTLSPG